MIVFKFIILPILFYFCLGSEKDDLLQNKVIREGLIAAQDSAPPNKNYVSVAIILCNVGVEGLVNGIMKVFSRLLKSILAFSKKVPLHIIIVTDENSYLTVRSCILAGLGKFLSESIIRFYQEEIISQLEDGTYVATSPKYVEAQVIVNTNLVNLFSEAIMGVTADQSGYYFALIRHLFKNNPEHKLTQDEMKQRGINSGVVLYHLDRMRRNKEYREARSVRNMNKIKEDLDIKNRFLFELADQDWFTLLMYTKPHLFQILPCGWNVQIPWRITVPEYQCTQKTFILHKHGDIHD